MSEDVTLLLAAQNAIRNGDRPHARQLLEEEIAKNPDNVRAWLWLAGLAPSAAASIDYVRRAEQLSPNDPGVKKARTWAEQRLAASGKSTPEQEAASATVEAPVARDDAQDRVAASAAHIDALREQQRASEDTAPRRRRWLLLLPLALLIAVLVTLPFWREPAMRVLAGNGANDLAQPVVAQADATATPTAKAQSAATSESAQPAGEQASLSFVSGHFAPRERVVSGDASSGDGVTEVEPTATPASLEAKKVEGTGNEPRPTWTLTPSPTFTPTATPTPVPTFISEAPVVSGGATRPLGVGPNERWIDVNLTTQTLVAYEGDTAVFNSRVSSGTWRHPTVTGQFRVWLRYTSQTMDGRRLGYDYYLPNVPYVMYFYRDYALHGTYWHNNFGTPMSHGCVNLPTPAAEWIFNWSSIGTMVSVHY